MLKRQATAKIKESCKEKIIKMEENLNSIYFR